MFSASPIQAFGSVRALGLAESGAPIRWMRSPPPWWPTMARRSASVTARTEAARRKRGSKWGKVRVASSDPRGSRATARSVSNRSTAARAPTLPAPTITTRSGVSEASRSTAPSHGAIMPSSSSVPISGVSIGTDASLVAAMPSTNRSRRSSAEGVTGVASRWSVKTPSLPEPGTEPSGVTTCTSAPLANAPATWRAIHPSSDLDSQWVANTTTTGRSGGAAIDDREVIPGASGDPGWEWGEVSSGRRVVPVARRRSGGSRCRRRRGGIEVEPQGQLGLVLRLRSLTVDHVLVELLAPEDELVAPLLKGLVDPDQMGEELPLLVQVGTEDAVGQATEQAHYLRLRASAAADGRCRVEGVGE